MMYMHIHLKFWNKLRFCKARGTENPFVVGKVPSVEAARKSPLTRAAPFLRSAIPWDCKFYWTVALCTRAASSLKSCLHIRSLSDPLASLALSTIAWTRA